MRILSVFKTPIIKTPRPRRLLNALETIHDVFYICPPEINEPIDQRRFGYLYRKQQSRFIRWVAKLSIKLRLFAFASIIESSKFSIPEIDDGEFDIIFVHDLYLLRKFTSFRKSKIVFDAREYYPTEFSDDPHWAATKGKLAEYTCTRVMPISDQIMTVSPTLVELYSKLLNREIIYFPSYPKKSYLISPNGNKQSSPIRLIHHGNAFENRGLERMIELMKILGDGFELDMMLVATPGNRYYEKLKDDVTPLNNVSIIDPVHPDAITEVCSQYHFGLYLMSVNDSQNRFCLPNKYFEFLFAGIPVITSFSRDMKKITDKHQLGLGFLDEPVHEIANAIRALDDETYQMFLENIAKHVPDWNVDNNIRQNFPELSLGSN